MRQLHYKRKQVSAIGCLLLFLATEGSRFLEKKVNETQVSKTVFGHPTAPFNNMDSKI